MRLKFQVDNRKNKVVATGKDEILPVVILVGKLRNDRLTKRWVVVEREAFSYEIEGTTGHEL
ncbi:MAG: hypothetical protein GZ094_24185 [Mariniphaga sp.]|nr:hypothetical protein [Mariniphaga sp.]